MILLDTDFLIDFLNGDRDTVDVMKKINEEDILCTTHMNTYEILVGIFYKNNIKLLQEFEHFLKSLMILNLEYGSVKISAKITNQLKKKGQVIGSEDCLIAGTALANGCKKIITRNKRHFERIEGIEVETY